MANEKYSLVFYGFVLFPKYDVSKESYDEVWTIPQEGQSQFCDSFTEILKEHI